MCRESVDDGDVDAPTPMNVDAVLCVTLTNVVDTGHVYWRQAELTNAVIDTSGDQSARVAN